MRLFWSALGGWGLILLLCLPALAKPSHDLHGGNCVAYARDVTGIHLDGNAAAWWPRAEGRYDRGHRPSVGAVLVFKPYARMHVGHVAVVSRVLGPREVLVDQANWVRGRVTTAMSVVDASPQNDWTSVKVQFAGTHGRENPTYGFIYPPVVPAHFGETIVEPQLAEHDAHGATRTAEKAKDKPTHAQHEEIHEALAKAPAPAHSGHHETKLAQAKPPAASPEGTVTAVPAKSDRSAPRGASDHPHHKPKAPDAKLAAVY